MTAAAMTIAAARATAVTIFGRLFENEFATLDDIAISCRADTGTASLEGLAALERWLGPDVGANVDGLGGQVVPQLHAAMLDATPEHDTVVSGQARHLRALLLEGHAPPPSTSMLRARGVEDIGAHLVAPDALEATSLAETIERARDLAKRNGMRHVLIVTTDGRVAVSGAPPFETMAHWHNIEFAARVECLRLEDAARD